MGDDANAQTPEGDIRALTLTQPWASLVAQGHKRIETRSWKHHYRGPLAIHAAKGLGPVGGRKGIRDLCQTEPFASALYDPKDPYTRTDRRLPLGAFVAVVQLVDIVPTYPVSVDVAARLMVAGEEAAFGDFSAGRYAWLLNDPVRLPEPIPCGGAQGVWNTSPDVGRQIAASYLAARVLA